MKSNNGNIKNEIESNFFSYDKENSQLVVETDNILSGKKSDSQNEKKSKIILSKIKQEKPQVVCALCSGNVDDEHIGSKLGVGLFELWLHDACFELTKLIDYQEDLSLEVLSNFQPTLLHGIEKFEYKKQFPRTSEELLDLLEEENIDCSLKTTPLIQPLVLEPLASDVLDIILGFIKTPENITTFENNADFYIEMIELHDLKLVCKGFHHAFNRNFPRIILKSIFSDRGFGVLENLFFSMKTPINSLAVMQSVFHPMSPFGKNFRRIFQLNDACYLFGSQLYNEEFNESQIGDMVVYGNKPYLLSGENRTYLQHSGKKKVHVFEGRFDYSASDFDTAYKGSASEFEENSNDEGHFMEVEGFNEIVETPSKKRKVAKELFPSDCK
jgi:uncharacterized Zn-finger protein